MLSLLIVDDHAIVRHGLRQIVAETDDIRVDAEAENSAQAVRLMRERSFDVVLLDISLPDKNGIETLKQLRREKPGIKILMLTSHPEDEFGVRALKAGAAGYLSKQSAAALLVTAIRQVASGKKYLSPAVAQQLAEAISDNSDKSPHERITDREYQVLVMIAAGKTLTQIAEALNLGVATVSTYRARLLEKMGLKSTAELIRYGLEHGLAE